jgi:hypothetical protein
MLISLVGINLSVCEDGIVRGACDNDELRVVLSMTRVQPTRLGVEKLRILEIVRNNWQVLSGDIGLLSISVCVASKFDRRKGT